MNKSTMNIIIYIFSILLTVSAANGIQSEVKMNLEEFQEMLEMFESARFNEAELRVMEQKKQHGAEHQRMIELDNAIRQSVEKAERNKIASQQALFHDNFKVLSLSADGIFNTSSATSGIECDIALLKCLFGNGTKVDHHSSSECNVCGSFEWGAR